MDLDIYFKSKCDLVLGDYTLLCDDINLLGLKPTKEIPLENYIGPILTDDLFQDQKTQKDDYIKKHLQKPGKSILITMGSQGNKEIFKKIINLLNQTNYKVFALYTSILKEQELPKVNDNILFIKYVPSVSDLNKKVDLVIIHGGRGTTYTAAYSGKPVIGIPNIHEQQSNIDCLVRNGIAIKLSKKFFNEKMFINSVEHIFTNYDFYLKNAKNLADKLPKPEGDKNAAEMIIKFLNEKK